MTTAPRDVSHDPLIRLPERRPDSHKGDFGAALLVGGSLGMAGSISLAGMAALRSGAGLVRLAVPEVILPTVASFEASYMTAALPCDGAGRITTSARAQLLPLLDAASVIACGPGLGRSADLTSLVGWLHASIARPMVFDADALNALAEWPDLLAQHAGERILTPHPGEFRRLLGSDEHLSRNEQESRAIEFAARNRLVVVLKGHRTLVTDGERSAHNGTGNPGMATGGTGDVLTGVVTALVGQGLPAFEAARLAAHVHGVAGDLAAEELGQVSLAASDLVRCLPAAFQSI